MTGLEVVDYVKKLHPEDVAWLKEQSRRGTVQATALYFAWCVWCKSPDKEKDLANLFDHLTLKVEYTNG